MALQYSSSQPPVTTSDTTARPPVCPIHPAVRKNGQCFVCGQQLQEHGEDMKNTSSWLTFNYVEHGLKIRRELADLVREKSKESLQQQRKLVLVVDLDHTLLQTCEEDDEAYHKLYQRSCSNPSAADFSDLCKLESMGLLTKLRPMARKFLAAASGMYEMYVYTMGSHRYGMAMSRLLDPEGMYFDGNGQKVITRSDCRRRGQKSLDALLCHPSTAVIFDDSTSVWHKGNLDNLVPAKRYDFSGFKEEGEGVGDDEEEDYYSLETVFGLLRRIHDEFFTDGSTKDVREVMNRIRQETLRGCRIVFSGVAGEEKEKLRTRAEQLGATCSEEVGPETTHVVSASRLTQKAWWAATNGRFLVTYKWFGAAYHAWQRQPEEAFQVLQE